MTIITILNTNASSHTSSFLHFLVDDHVVFARSLQDLAASLALALGLVAWNRRRWSRRLSRDPEHGGLHHWRLVGHQWLRIWLRVGLRAIPVLERAQDLMLLPLLPSLDLLGALLEQVQRLAALLGQVRHGLQLLLPELGDGDGLLLLVCAFSTHPLLVGVF